MFRCFSYLHDCVFIGYDVHYLAFGFRFDDVREVSASFCDFVHPYHQLARAARQIPVVLLAVRPIAPSRLAALPPHIVRS